jgi:hypothetical protein
MLYILENTNNDEGKNVYAKPVSFRKLSVFVLHAWKVYDRRKLILWMGATV